MRRPQRKRIRASAQQQPAADGEPAARPHRDKFGVLVADNEHLLRVMVQLGLEQDGSEVWLASKGREVIDLYREHRDHIAVVLLDVRMPASSTSRPRTASCGASCPSASR